MRFFVLCLDLGTKVLASSSYGLGEEHEFLFLSIIHIQNPGISLGLFTQLGLIDNGVQMPIYVFAIAGTLGAVVIVRRLAEAPLFWLPAGLLLGGLGNVLELIYHGYATDFIHVPGLARSGSANVADFSIVMGLTFFFIIDLGMVLSAFLKRRREVAAGSSLG